MHVLGTLFIYGWFNLVQSNLWQFVCAWTIKTESVAEEIGLIRKAIVKAKRELRQNTKNGNENYTQNINKILSVINKNEINANDKTIIIELFEAIRNSNDDNLAMDLLDTLDTMNL